jgi:hypothetical protein
VARGLSGNCCTYYCHYCCYYTSGSTVTPNATATAVNSATDLLLNIPVFICGLVGEQAVT